MCCWTVRGPGSPTAWSLWPRPPVSPPASLWPVHWSGPLDCANAAWPHPARGGHRADAGSIPSSGRGLPRRSTDRSTNPRAVDMARAALTKWTPPPGSPRKTRSADSRRPCCRRWWMRARPTEVSPRQPARTAPRSLRPRPSPPTTRSTTSPEPTRQDPARVLPAASTTRRGGLNIVGPFEGTSVEADVARRLAVALRAGGVPISTTSYHRDDRDLGSAWSHRGPSDFPFDVNLLVVHPDQMTDFVLDSGPGLFHGRYTIGLWVWDLQAAVVVDGRRGPHGARGVDPYLVGVRERLLGTRRARPLRPHPCR